MSFALHLAGATANTVTIKRGVATYRIKSRQLLRIHGLRLGTAAGTAGTVCGRENAVTCCMRSGHRVSQPRAKINVALSTLRKAEASRPTNIIGARGVGSLRVPVHRISVHAEPCWRGRVYVRHFPGWRTEVTQLKLNRCLPV